MKILSHSAALERYGYSQDDIVLLTDDSQNPSQIPTKANMLRAMEWLVRDAQPNDSLFFHCEFLRATYGFRFERSTSRLRSWWPSEGY